jgi:hypothetical protein
VIFFKEDILYICFIFNFLLSVSIPASHNYFGVSSTRQLATIFIKKQKEFSELPAERAGNRPRDGEQNLDEWRAQVIAIDQQACLLPASARIEIDHRAALPVFSR